MAALLNPLDETTNAAAPATANTSTAGGSSGAVAGSTTGPSGAQAAPTGTQAGVDSGSANQTDPGKISALNQGFNFSPLLDSVRGQGTAARGAINTANTGFNAGLGATPTFGNNQQNTLLGVINGTDKNFADGSNILGFNPTAPTGINNASYDPLVSQYQTSANQTSNQAGISSLLSSQRPDLTPGDLSFDSTAFGANPNFQNQSRNIVNDANNVSNLAGTTTTNANNAVAQRGLDVSAFDAAGKGFVNSRLQNINNQLAQQQTAANTYDQGVNTALTGLRGQTALNTSPMYNFDPSQYNQTEFAAQQPGNPFDEKVTPNAFLTYNQGQFPTAANTANAGQITQFNNANRLLGTNNQMTSAPRTAANIGIDAAQWQAALARAAADRNASDVAWLAAHQPPPPPPPVQADVVPNVVNGSGGMDGSGSEGGAGGDGGEGESKGGFVKPFAKANVPVARKNYQSGGAVPMNAGPPGVDTVPTNVNNGEYVMQAPSTLAIGASNLNGLNRLNAANPVQQQAVRNALHAALTQSIGKRNTL